MASPKGCLKTSMFGCLILVGLAVIGALIMALLAWSGLDKGGRVEEEVAPAVAERPAAADPARLTTRHPGRVVLDLGQGEFHIHPADAGAGLSARASFDSEVHAITESYRVNPDSTWIYELGFHQTMPGMQALFRKLMGGDTDAVIHVYLPPEVPIELVTRMAQGGGEVELGGLWLTTADFDVRQGGFALSVDTPLRAPVERFRLHARMGGTQALFLGNASPRVLDVDCGMGGADINLTGAWRNDCDARLAVRMGGMDVRVPADMPVRVDGDVTGADGPDLSRTDDEVPVPELRIVVRQSMGEVQIGRR